VGRDRGDTDVPRERHEPDPEPRGRALEEPLRGRLRRIEPRRGDVGREHRPRRVEDEDDRRVLDRSRPVDVRPGDCDAERHERDREERRPGVPPEPRGTGRRHAAEHVDVRIADDIAGPAARQADVRADESGEHREREERQRTVEGHRSSGRASIVSFVTRCEAAAALRGRLRCRP